MPENYSYDYGFYVNGTAPGGGECEYCSSELVEQKCLTCEPSYYVTPKTGRVTSAGHRYSSFYAPRQLGRPNPSSEADKLKNDIKILINYVKEEIKYNNTTSIRRTDSVDHTLQGVLEHCEAVLED